MADAEPRHRKHLARESRCSLAGRRIQFADRPRRAKFRRVNCGVGIVTDLRSIIESRMTSANARSMSTPGQSMRVQRAGAAPDFAARPRPHRAPPKSGAGLASFTRVLCPGVDIDRASFGKWGYVLQNSIVEDAIDANNSRFEFAAIPRPL